MLMSGFSQMPRQRCRPAMLLPLRQRRRRVRHPSGATTAALGAAAAEMPAVAAPVEAVGPAAAAVRLAVATTTAMSVAALLTYGAAVAAMVGMVAFYIPGSSWLRLPVAHRLWWRPELIQHGQDPNAALTLLFTLSCLDQLLRANQDRLHRHSLQGLPRWTRPALPSPAWMRQQEPLSLYHATGSH